MAIGMFDGVHRGHRTILKKAVREALRLRAIPAALTFPAHPSRVLTPAHPVPLLQTFGERRAAILACGIKNIFLLNFTERLSKFTPSEFVDRVLFRHWNVRGVVVGRDFRFGKNRSGGVEELRLLLARRGAALWAVDPVRIGRRVVQSTAIRRFLMAGRVDRAEKMLGHVVTVAGYLERGSGLGKKLGARTLNLNLRNGLLPKFGVYAGWISPSRSPKPPKRPAVMNLGVAPTVRKNRPVLLEVHVLDGRRVAYRSGDELIVELVEYLRPERKFPSLDALTRAIRRDVARAKKIVKERRNGYGKIGKR